MLHEAQKAWTPRFYNRPSRYIGSFSAYRQMFDVYLFGPLEKQGISIQFGQEQYDEYIFNTLQELIKCSTINKIYDDALDLLLLKGKIVYLLQ
jgi:hypothetical protein